jgi:hypothetical protein
MSRHANFRRGTVAICGQCGGPLPKARTAKGRPLRFCSPRCAALNAQAARRDYYGEDFRAGVLKPWPDWLTEALPFAKREGSR